MTTYWKKLLKQKTAQDFLGREQEIELFKSLLGDEPKYLVAHFFGVGGIGKTTLLDRFESIASEQDVIFARVNETQKSLFDILAKFSQDIQQLNYSLDNFTQAYENTQSLLADLNTNQKFAEVLREILGRVYSPSNSDQLSDEQSTQELSREQNHLKQMISTHQRRLQRFKEQEALQGSNTPPETYIQIEQETKKLDQAVAKLAEIELQQKQTLPINLHFDTSVLLMLRNNVHFSQFVKQYYVHNSEQQSLLLNTEEELTAAFIRDLAGITSQQHVLLLFDTWEFLAKFANQWLNQNFMNHLLENVGANITIVMAGREPLGSAWQPYASLISQTELIPFSSEEVRAFLLNRGIVDTTAIEAIQTLSRNLPLMLALLSTETTAKIDELSATQNIIEHFLKWIPQYESIKREAIVLCAFPRFYDERVIAHLIAEGDAKEYFGWLCDFSFTHGHTGRWQYHKIVRSLMLQHRLDQNQSQFSAIHEKLTTYYDNLLKRSGFGEELFFDDPNWQLLKLEWLYHMLCQNKGFESFVILFLKTFRISSFVGDLINTFLAAQEDLREHSSFSEWVPLFEDVPLKDNMLNFSSTKCVPIFERLTQYEGLTDPHLRSLVHYQLGYLYAIQKRYLPAENSYQKAISIEPSYVSPYNSLAILFELTNREEEAEALYRRCLTLKPNYLYPYHHLGRLLSKFDRLDEAEEIYRQALDIYDIILQPVSYFHYGNFLTQRERYTEAEEIYRKAIELNPSYAEAYLGLGDVLEKTEQYDELPAIYERAVQLDPKNYQAHLKLGLFQASIKQTKAAIDTFYHCLEINETLPNAYIPLARQLIEDDRSQEALIIYRRVDDIISNNPALKFFIAELYETFGQYDKAIGWYEAYLALAPDDEETRQHLIDIKGD